MIEKSKKTAEGKEISTHMNDIMQSNKLKEIISTEKREEIKINELNNVQTNVFMNINI